MPVGGDLLRRPYLVYSHLVIFGKCELGNMLRNDIFAVDVLANVKLDAENGVEQLL